MLLNTLTDTNQPGCFWTLWQTLISQDASEHFVLYCYHFSQLSLTLSEFQILMLSISISMAIFFSLLFKSYLYLRPFFPCQSNLTCICGHFFPLSIKSYLYLWPFFPCQLNLTCICGHFFPCQSNLTCICSHFFLGYQYFLWSIYNKVTSRV